MLETCSDLVRAGRCKDGPRNASGEQTTANVAGEARFVTGASAADQGDVGSGGRKSGGVTIDYLVRFVEDEGGVCEGQGAEGCEDGVGGVVDEVFG